MNIIDYIDCRGDITFDERGFNEVDNLIFSELAYLDMVDIVSSENKFTVTLAELCEKYMEMGYDQSYIINDPKALLTKAADCERYRDVRVGGYVDIVNQDQQVQFSGVTFLPGDGTAYAAFRGTDNTIVGWREDFNISFMPETPGQSEAADYLNRLAADTDYPLRVGGHSKGGNFAVYAAAFCDEQVRDERIIEVYSNDGPGFNSGVVDSEQYNAILDKLVKIVPESSLVGMLLSSKAKPKVIKSNAKGLMQHDPYTWCVRGTSFEEADGRSPVSLFMDETLDNWIDSLNDEQKRAVVSAIFDSLDASGASTITQINENKLLSYNAIVRAVGSLDRDTSSKVIESLRKLADAGKGVFLDGARKSWEQIEKTIRSQTDQKQ